MGKRQKIGVTRRGRLKIGRPGKEPVPYHRRVGEKRLKSNGGETEGTEK